MRILIVEDEKLIAYSLTEKLVSNGYDVAGVSQSGEDALEKIRSLRPELVLMDIDLSGEMDGVETADRILAEFSIPVIFLTAHDGPEYLDRAKRTQPFGYLVKPVRHIDLVSTLEMASYKHQIERKLRQREAWLATTLRCAGDGVVVTGADGRIEFLNDASIRILGIEGQNVIGVEFGAVVRLKNKFTGTPAGDLVLLTILQGSTMSIGSDLVLDVPGHQSDIEGEIALSECDGSIAGTVFTFRDVTIRNHQEEHRLRDRGNRACVRLATAVSTELQELLRGPSTTQGSDALARIVDQLEVVRSVTASFSQPMSLNRLISDTCLEIRQKIHSGIEFHFQLQSDLPMICGDPGQIREALISLIQYSRDFTPTGTIHIATQSDGVERRVPTGRADNYVRLTINHTSGEEGRTDRPFEPFLGADASSDKLDVRLFLVHRIISGARGSIRGGLNPGGRMRFDILLPQASEMAEKPEKPAVLLLQAEHGIRTLISNHLEREGYDPLGARNIIEALEWINLHPDPIALLIADLDLLKQGSFTLSEISISHPGIRVLVTADRAVSAEIRTECERHEARLFERPFRLEELLKAVNDVLTQAGTKAQNRGDGIRADLRGVPEPVC